MLKPQTSISRALGFVIATIALSLSAVAQTDPGQFAMEDMASQLGKFSGSMHTVARACGDYSEEQLAEMKQQQREQLKESGMDISGFDKAFASSESETARRWETMSEAEQKATCEKIKQQMSAAPAAG